VLDRAYDFIVGDEDVRVCKDISEDACRYIPVNFFSLIVSKTLSKLGDELANAKTVLAWLLSYVQAPLFLVGFLVPVRESGSMLPQMLIAAWVRRMPVRKRVWIIGSVIQAAVVACMGVAAWRLQGAAAGWTIIGLLVVFSLARGLSSISAKDVLGKTIPKTRRGRLNGIAAGLSGLLAIGLGLYLSLRMRSAASPVFYGVLLASAGCLWLLAAVVFSLVREHPGATEGGGNAISEAFCSMRLLKDDAPFRSFVIVRALLLCSALSAPYYVLLATSMGGATVSTLGMFVLANGLASSLSAPVWGRLADASSKMVLVRAGMLTSGLGITMALIVFLVPTLAASTWIYPLAFFVLGIAHSGVRLGRKTYVIDMAGGNKRTDYVAVSNTVIGFILLLTSMVGLLAGLISPAGVILVLSFMGVAGVAFGNLLPEVQ
jgi:hypothetical protein